MFIGRKEYLDSLEMLWNKSTASLVTCRGRRRIGKSTLIEEFAARTADHFIEIEGGAAALQGNDGSASAAPFLPGSFRPDGMSPRCTAVMDGGFQDA